METNTQIEDQPAEGAENSAAGSLFSAKKLLPVGIGVVCLVLGTALGWMISHLLSPGRDVPPGVRIERMCAIDPSVRVRPWTHIVLHHSADDVGDAAAFDRTHRRRGWRRGLGYDFVIGNGTLSGDGEIEVGDRWRRQETGAHCKADGMNRKAIGICFVGNFETGGGPSAAQLLAGAELIQHLAARFAIPPENILGHGRVNGAKTLCPGKHFPIDFFRVAAGSRLSPTP